MTQEEIEKVEEWIDRTFFEYDTFCGVLITEVCTHFASKHALIQDFSKYMEE